MKKMIPLLFFLCTGMLHAQVGINTTDPKAQLDIRSANPTAPTNQDGLLIPKIDTFPAINPTVDQNGMLVFLTTTVGTNAPGFYYWEQATTSWKGIGNDNTKWGLTGNAGTVFGTHFIGTTDNQDIIFRRNNVHGGRLGGTVTGFGTMSTLSSAANNSAFGHRTLTTTTGGSNTAIGAFSLQGNGSGVSNTGVGVRSMENNTFGSQNTGIGQFALPDLTQGDNNIGLGYNSGMNITTGSNNIAIGANTLFNTNGISQLNIGNTIYGSLAGNKNIGINSVFPQAMLDVSATNQGMLIPRVALTTAVAAAPVINPQGVPLVESTLVYNTATAGTAPDNVTPGFHYWNGSKWLRIDADEAKNKWGVNGNAGTNAATHFIGTTDNQNVVFKRNNVRAGTLSGIITSFGLASLSNATAYGSAAFGLMAGQFMGGIHSTAIGYQSLYQSTGDGNVGLGSSTLSSLQAGNDNTAIGLNALSNITGSTANNNNVAVGANAGSSILAGSGNIMIGANADSTPSSTNKLNIGNTIYGNIGAGKNIGINTIAPRGMLEVSSTTNGILIPRVSLTATNIQLPVVNPQGGALPESTLVYNVSTTGTAPDNVSPGFYYWNGTRWLRIDADEAKNKWGLTGNTGTNAATNFIGTTDNVDVVFKRANQPGGRLGNSYTAFGAGAMPAVGFANTAIGSIAMANLSGGAFGNTALGFETMNAPTTAYHNTALGRSALRESNDGFQNTAVGAFAMDVAHGDNNTAVGFLAMPTNTGNDNTALGFLSMPSSGGTGNTAIGSYASTGNGTNTTAIGYRALATGNNALVLGSVDGINGATASVNVGIGTTTPLAALEVADENVVTSGTGRGNLNVMTSSPGAIDVGGAITLGGYRDPAASTFRVFGSVEGRKTDAVANSSDGYLMFKTNLNGTLHERMRITHEGNIGFGISAPEAMLHLFAGESGTVPNINSRFVIEDDDAAYQHFLTPAANESGLLFGTSAGSIRGGMVFNNVNVASGFQFRVGGNVTRMTLTANGDLGIGTIAPGGQLQLTLDEGRKPATGTWTTVSDERLKTIHGAYAKGLEEISKLQPIVYNYKNVGERIFEPEVLGKEYAGFSAQEVQKVFPEAVGVDADGYLNFNMHPILVASVNAIKTLQQQNEQLLETNRKLQQQLEEHEKKLQDILDRLPEHK
ncbi:tail fiber domain-containing protein [Flavobacterium sp.]|uniref:tail fiber domain-containing protein n=1 Tax=Flavobacterium sp. TaxID=239 RepID=UPI0039E5B557